MPRQQQTAKNKIHDLLDEVKTLRDTIRVDLKLATMELRDEWKSLEKKVPDASAAVDQIKDATSETMERLAGELRVFRDRLRGGGQPVVTIAAIMSKPPVTCVPSDTLGHAVSLMWDRDLGWLPVLSPESRLVGVITDRDAAIAACTRGLRMEELRVESVMSTNLVSCAPDATPEQALGLMRSGRVRRLVVVGSDGAVSGVVTLSDLARVYAGRGEAAADAARLAEIVEALATITEPGGTSGPTIN